MIENSVLSSNYYCRLLVGCVWSGRKNSSTRCSASYVQALQAADAFLWAWVNRDADTGRRLISRSLSSKLQKENNEEWFRNYMIGLSNPHHHSFEIGSGKRINTERFSSL